MSVSAANLDTAVSGWVPDVRHDFGARLALVRQHHGWNIKEAGEACGVDPESWRNWETQGRRPRNYQTVCEQIADRSGCQAIWLMTGVVAGVRFELTTSGLRASDDHTAPVIPLRRPVQTGSVGSGILEPLPLCRADFGLAA